MRYAASDDDDDDDDFSEGDDDEPEVAPVVQITRTGREVRRAESPRAIERRERKERQVRTCLSKRFTVPEASLICPLCTYSPLFCCPT